MDFDDNPFLLHSDGTTLFIKNKNGKVLWTKRIDLHARWKYQITELLVTSKNY